MNTSKSAKAMDDGQMADDQSKDENRSDTLKAYLGLRAELDRSNSVSSWRMQDPINVVQHKMEILQRILPVQDQSNASNYEQDIFGTEYSQTLSPPKGSNFQIQETLMKICKEKQSVIHKAFDAAAFSILRAMCMQKQQVGNLSSICYYKDGNAGNIASGEMSSCDGDTTETELSDILKMVNNLNRAKKNALDVVAKKQTDRIKKRKRGSTKDFPGSSSPSVTTAAAVTGKNDNSTSRSNLSKAILCAVASLVFKELTPPLFHDYGDDRDTEDIDVLNIPQNKSNHKLQLHGSNLDVVVPSKEKDNHGDGGPGLNMGQVTLSAEMYSKRIVEQVQGVILRNERRRRWRIICAQNDLKKKEKWLCLSSHSNPLDQYLKWNDLLVDSPCEKSDELSQLLDEDSASADKNGTICGRFEDLETESSPRISVKEDEEWAMGCLPRILSIMKTGSGNVIFHDMKWTSRYNRIVQVLGAIGKSMEKKESYEANHGPHLIITTEIDIDAFMSMLGPISYCASRQEMESRTEPLTSCFLRGLKYHGSPSLRRSLRERHFGAVSLSGLANSPFSVIVTTYQTFLQDYAHFCQIPFEVVVMDDGMSWLSLAHFDPNGQLGKVYNMAIWSKNDNYAGLAGKNTDWDFSADIAPDGMMVAGSINDDKVYPLFGLTARYRFLVASSMHSKYGDVIYKAPVQALLSFVFPHFFDVVKEEWDRNKMNNCKESIEYIRSMLCRVIVVYSGSGQPFTPREMYSLAMAAMLGRESALKKSEDIYSIKAKKVLTENLIAEGKITSSRRFVSSWLRTSSPIRFELGTASLTPTTDAFKTGSTNAGFLCEEIVTACSLKSPGSSVEDYATHTFKPALRCGRRFATEQGLRQHVAAFHAPPGTWLCRTCAADCATSQARTQHERSCGSKRLDFSAIGLEEDVSPVRKGTKAKKNKLTPTNTEVRDDEGNLRVPSYKGVWVNSDGKYFIKIEGDTLKKSAVAGDVFFDEPDDAAKRYDEILKIQAGEQSELNFKPDGSRIQYDNSCSISVHGRALEVFGSGSANVVPALAVINIKDLPDGVVPLLRDPIQTSRSGGNIKRHIYKYRGVCRQARKGHDRWQSQISFGGHNHYLGTFDTEWDAAAIYAWAHLILYGEEATKKAQREGEEAVAAYERQQKEGIVPEVPKKITKQKTKSVKSEGHQSKLKKDDQLSLNLSTNLKHVVKRVAGEYHTGDIEQLMPSCIERILAQSKDTGSVSRCISVAGLPQSSLPTGCAMLVGLSSDDCAWRPEDFVDSIKSSCQIDDEFLLALIRSECSLNTRFKTLVQGIPCFIGKASQVLEQAAATLGLFGIDVGGTIGVVDCNIGGISGSCGEIASCISYCHRRKDFTFFSCTEDDIVTLNGMRLKSSMGRLTLKNGHVCSVGSRVFMFVLPDE